MSQIVGLASVKGAPGVTSLALTLCAVWPRPVLLVEADPSGGDLTYRCRAAHGGVLHHGRSVLTLAAAAHSGAGSARAHEFALDHAQRLSCGVDVVAGCATAAQAPGLQNLWGDIANGLRDASVDTVIDLGRIHPAGSSAFPLHALDALILLGTASLSSAMHLTEAVKELTPRLGPRGTRVIPALLGPDGSAEQDCGDVDELLRGCAVRPERTGPIPVDEQALLRLESGERASGRLGRTLLLRRASQLARRLAAVDEAASA